MVARMPRLPTAPTPLPSGLTARRRRWRPTLRLRPGRIARRWPRWRARILPQPRL